MRMITQFRLVPKGETYRMCNSTRRSRLVVGCSANAVPFNLIKKMYATTLLMWPDPKPATHCITVLQKIDKASWGRKSNIRVV
jgi:hypothetical protein